MEAFSFGCERKTHGEGGRKETCRAKHVRFDYIYIESSIFFPDIETFDTIYNTSNSMGVRMGVPHPTRSMWVGGGAALAWRQVARGLLKLRTA